MHTLWQDLRFALRMLLKNWSISAIIIVVLALGSGANTAIFSVVNAALLRPLPYADPDKLVRLTEDSPQVPQMSISYPNFLDWREQNKVFSGIAAMQFRSLNLTGKDEPERLAGRAVSAEFFDLLGVKPALGRSFASEEDRPGANPVCILSQSLWQRRFGSDPTLVNKQINLSGGSYTVIGVLPASYAYGTPTDVFVPIGLRADEMKERSNHPGIYALARLKPGVKIEAARADLIAMAQRIGEQYGMKGNSATLTPLSEVFAGDIRTTLLILLGAVAFVLAIACANVANLLLARAATRQKEMAIRTALGARRMLIVRQLLTESLLLAIVGGIIGVLVALWGIDLLRSASADSLPSTAIIKIDGNVLLFTLLVSLVTGIVFGLAPAFAAAKIDLQDTLKEGGRSSAGGGRSSWLRSTLVVTEVALSLMLLVGAGLLIRSFVRILHTDPGFKPQNLLTMQLALNAEKNDGGKVLNFFNDLNGRLAALPGVESAAFSNGIPLGQTADTSFGIVGRPKPEAGKQPQTMLYITSPDYLQAMGIRLVKGRFFTAQDTQRSPRVAVIDEAFVRQQFPDGEPLGQSIAGDGKDNPDAQIVGVVAHVKHFGLDAAERVQPQLYLPFNQAPNDLLPFLAPRMNLIIRTTADPLNLTAAVRREVQALDPNQPVYNVSTMERVLDQSLVTQRLSMTLLAFLASLALILAAVGIYGVMSYTVSQRSHEIGIRMAIGAQPRDVFKMVIGRGMLLALIGVGLGLVGAFALTRLMTTMLFGVEPTDAATFVLIGILLTGVALVACYVPSRRATKVDPLVALRYE
ncbi:MAG TPA: ABC transporter permease [Pyrinomonadaceae bacterium]|jgi:putative ABC transport system permease protein|nr:ABC transporter permease [Pyrinomonadaceae bacterium]